MPRYRKVVGVKTGHCLRPLKFTDPPFSLPVNRLDPKVYRIIAIILRVIFPCQNRLHNLVTQKSQIHWIPNLSLNEQSEYPQSKGTPSIAPDNLLLHSRRALITLDSSSTVQLQDELQILIDANELVSVFHLQFCSTADQAMTGYHLSYFHM